VVLFAKEKCWITKKGYQEINRITDRTALRDLELLLELDLLKGIGEKKGAYYELRT
jgi:ATP-dependent DNA helicase RecG